MMTRILCIETSAKVCSVALGEGARVLSSRLIEEAWSHSKMITVLIQECLEEAELALDDLDAVAVSSGPGSYTGLRVGVSCAKGLCYGSDLKLISIPTLDIIAHPYLKESLDWVIPMIDARRMEVYHKVIATSGLKISDTSSKILDDKSFFELKDYRVMFCGDGCQKMDNFNLSPNWQIDPQPAKALNMLPLAAKKFLDEKFEDVAYFTPFYLKPPNITKSKKSLF